jgi:hypothetical protein
VLDVRNAATPRVRTHRVIEVSSMGAFIEDPFEVLRRQLKHRGLLAASRACRGIAGTRRQRHLLRRRHSFLRSWQNAGFDLAASCFHWTAHLGRLNRAHRANKRR